MKFFFLITTLLTTTLFTSGIAFAASEKTETISQERYDSVCKWGIFNPPECKKKISKIKKNNSSNETTETYRGDCKWGIFNPPKCRKNYKGDKSKRSNNSKTKVNALTSGDQNISMYTGTFDILDKEGDEQTTLLGVEHKNENLFRDTWLGRFSPTTGGFVTGKSSLYLYSGVEADYNLGPLSISPSFAPGYYKKGDGKDLGSVLEFKSEVRIGLDILENSNIGYSYSHISNNDWGKRNPGTDNQSITYSKKF